MTRRFKHGAIEVVRDTASPGSACRRRVRSPTRPGDQTPGACGRECIRRERSADEGGAGICGFLRRRRRTTASAPEGPKGPVLQFVGTKNGEMTTALLAGDRRRQRSHALPIARRMRWGAGEQEFVRPVHWVVMLFGSDSRPRRVARHARRQSIPADIAFMHRAKSLSQAPAKYCETLLRKAPSSQTSPSGVNAFGTA